MKLKSLSLGLVLIVIFAAAKAQTRHLQPSSLFFAQGAAVADARQPSDITDEAPLPQDREEREARMAKNIRYNGGRCNITTQDCFFESVYPTGLPLIPSKESAVAFVGQVTHMQSYLSDDKTRIYTETTFYVEEVFKNPTNFRFSSDRTLVIDRNGGAIRLHSGQIVRDSTRDGFLGRPQVGMRYVFFATSIHDGRDFSMVRGYELRDGKVFRLTEDGRPSASLVPDLPQEQTFLQAVRARFTEESRSSL
jgi:hypothetical protein